MKIILLIINITLILNSCFCQEQDESRINSINTDTTLLIINLPLTEATAPDVLDGSVGKMTLWKDLTGEIKKVLYEHKSWEGSFSNTTIYLNENHPFYVKQIRHEVIRDFMMDGSVELSSIDQTSEIVVNDWGNKLIELTIDKIIETDMDTKKSIIREVNSIYFAAIP